MKSAATIVLLVLMGLVSVTIVRKHKNPRVEPGESFMVERTIKFGLRTPMGLRVPTPIEADQILKQAELRLPAGLELKKLEVWMARRPELDFHLKANLKVAQGTPSGVKEIRIFLRGLMAVVASTGVKLDLQNDNNTYEGNGVFLLDRIPVTCSSSNESQEGIGARK